MKTLLLIFFISLSSQAMASDKSCMKNSDCDPGFQCAPVKGEFPGGCAHSMKDVALKKKGCMKNSDCGAGKVCATIKGEYPGGCADGLR